MCTPSSLPFLKRRGLDGRALYVGSDLANLEVLHVSHAVDHFLRLLLAERIERAILCFKCACSASLFG